LSLTPATAAAGAVGSALMGFLWRQAAEERRRSCAGRFYHLLPLPPGEGRGEGGSTSPCVPCRRLPPFRRRRPSDLSAHGPWAHGTLARGTWAPCTVVLRRIAFDASAPSAPCRLSLPPWPSVCRSLPPPWPSALHSLQPPWPSALHSLQPPWPFVRRWSRPPH